MTTTVFHVSRSSHVDLSRQFDLPEKLKGPYMIEAAREKGAYEDPRKWILLCIFVSYDSLRDV